MLLRRRREKERRVFTRWLFLLILAGSRKSLLFDQILLAPEREIETNLLLSFTKARSSASTATLSPRSLTAIADFESRQEKEESLSSARRPEKGEESRKPGKDSRVKEASSTLFFLIGALVKRELRFTTQLESFFFFQRQITTKQVQR